MNNNPVKTEEELLERNDRYQALADAAPLCIKWFDTKGNLISVNKHGREEHFLTGKTEEEIKNWQYMNCIEKNCHEELKTKMKLTLEGKEQTILLEHVPGTSTGHWCFSNLVPVKDQSGQLKYVLFISRDITAEREADELRNKAIAELTKFKESAVGRELKMVELKKSLKMAQDESPELKKEQGT
ncbi:MAG: PAS domain-containing protein [Patescibacteria group bacterium]